MIDTKTEEILKGAKAISKKLFSWYGEDLHKKEVTTLHTLPFENEIMTAVFMVKEGTKVEIARVFTLVDDVAISIDLQCDVSTISGIRKLIQYGGKFACYEIEDEE
jgi:hypothetical protein